MQFPKLYHKLLFKHTTPYLPLSLLQQVNTNMDKGDKNQIHHSSRLEEEEGLEGIYLVAR